MIVLKRKKIRLMILGMFVLSFGLLLLTDKKETVPTVSLPVTGKTIVIDARASENLTREQRVVEEQQKQKLI